MKSERYNFDLQKQTSSEIVKEIGQLIQKHNTRPHGHIYVSPALYRYLDDDLVTITGLPSSHTRLKCNGKLRRLFGRMLHSNAALSYHGLATIELKTIKNQSVCFSKIFKSYRKHSTTDTDAIGQTIYRLIFHYSALKKGTYEIQSRIQRMFDRFENKMGLGASLLWDVTDNHCKVDLSVMKRVPMNQLNISVKVI